jgi:hypothetical protein
MAKIDSYRRGQIIIDGKRYTSDVIVFPQQIKSNWCRKSGHEVCPEDIKEIAQEKPEIFLVGTGVEEGMQVLPETEQYLKEGGLNLSPRPLIKPVRPIINFAPPVK